MDNFFQHFRSFLGLPIYDKHDYPLEDERNPDDFDSRYDAFSDPMEMHHYFEQQMNKILRNFDIFEFGKSDSFFGDFSGSGIEFFGQHSDQFPSLEDKSKGGELRDQFLKPGYERPTQKHLMDKSDKELDESKISIHDLDSVLTGKFFKDKQEQPKVTTRVFGRSISTKTVVNPDGSMEIHKTIRDNEGNEETTITKKIGDKEHSVIRKKDSSGKEEIIENFINIDEKHSISEPSQDKPWTLFDKFFK